MEFTFISILCLIVSVQASDSEFAWRYEGATGPSNWTIGFPKCGGRYQSPIDVPPVEEIHYSDIPQFTLHGFDNPQNYQLTLLNNGHSIKLNIDGDVYVTGGGLAGKYRTAQLHFHWGENDRMGSEHLYNGRHFPMEMHIVNWNEKYDNISTAVPQPDGLAVLGFWFVAVNYDNDNYQPLVDAVSMVSFEGEKKAITGLNVMNLLPKYITDFFRYKGSLTTPTCDESVTWTIFNERISISKRQLAKFRKVYQKPRRSSGQHRLEHNYRPPQPMNNRVVYRNFELVGNTASQIIISNSLYFISLCLFVRVILP